MDMEKFTVVTNGEGSVKLTLSNIVGESFERRNIYWWYKLATEPESKWKKHGYTRIDFDESGSKQYTITGLTPNRQYNFSASIWSLDRHDVAFEKIREIFANAKTSPGLGTLVFPSVLPHSVTATVEGLETREFGREVRYYVESDSHKWVEKGRRTIPAGVSPYDESVQLPFTFTGLLPEKQYKFAADFHRKDVHAEMDYYRTAQGTVMTPAVGVSMPEIFDTDKVIVGGNPCRTNVPPSPNILLTWWIPPGSVDEDTVGGTTFGLFYKRAGDELPTLIEEFTDVEQTSMTVDEGGVITTTQEYWGQATLDAGDWLLDPETFEVWVEAVCEDAVAESNHAEISATRLFYWDTDKEANQVFGITAAEWNRLTAYLDEAHTEFPDDFDDVTPTSETPGTALTALLANDVDFLGGIEVNQHWPILAVSAESLAERIREKMRQVVYLEWGLL